MTPSSAGTPNLTILSGNNDRLSGTSKSTEATPARRVTGTSDIAFCIGEVLRISSSWLESRPEMASSTGSIAAHGMSMARAKEFLAIRHSSSRVKVGSDTEATWPASCGSISPAVSVTPPSSCHTQESWKARDSPVDLRHPALLGRALRGAAQQRLEPGQDERLLGGEQHAGADRRHLENERQGVRRLLRLRGGPGELHGVDELELHRHAQLRGQPRIGGLAERLGGAHDSARLVGGELGRSREVDGAQPVATAARLLGRAGV